MDPTPAVFAGNLKPDLINNNSTHLPNTARGASSILDDQEPSSDPLFTSATRAPSAVPVAQDSAEFCSLSSSASISSHIEADWRIAAAGDAAPETSPPTGLPGENATSGCAVTLDLQQQQPTIASTVSTSSLHDLTRALSAESGGGAISSASRWPTAPPCLLHRSAEAFPGLQRIEPSKGSIAEADAVAAADANQAARQQLLLTPAQWNELATHGSGTDPRDQRGPTPSRRSIDNSQILAQSTYSLQNRAGPAARPAAELAPQQVPSAAEQRRCHSFVQGEGLQHHRRHLQPQQRSQQEQYPFSAAVFGSSQSPFSSVLAESTATTAATREAGPLPFVLQPASSGGSITSTCSGSGGWPRATSPLSSRSSRASVLIPVFDTILHSKPRDRFQSDIAAWPVPVPYGSQWQGNLRGGTPAIATGVPPSPPSPPRKPLLSEPSTLTPVLPGQDKHQHHQQQELARHRMQQLQELQRQLDEHQQLLTAAIAQAAEAAGTVAGLAGPTDAVVALPPGDVAVATLPDAITALQMAHVPAASPGVGLGLASFTAPSPHPADATAAAPVGARGGGSQVAPTTAAFLAAQVSSPFNAPATVDAATAAQQVALASPAALAALAASGALTTPASIAAAADALAAMSVAVRQQQMQHQQQQERYAAAAAAQAAHAALYSHQTQLQHSLLEQQQKGMPLSRFSSSRSTASNASDGPSSSGCSGSQHYMAMGSLQNSAGGAGGAGGSATSANMQPRAAHASAAAAAAARGEGADFVVEASEASSSSAAHSEESAVSFTRANLVIPASGNQPAQTVAVTVATTSDGRQSVTLPAAALSQILPISTAAGGGGVLPPLPLAAFAAPSEAPPPATGGGERHPSLASSPATTAAALANAVFSNPTAVANLMGTTAAANPAAAAAALLDTGSAVSSSSAGGINPGNSAVAMPLTLQALQGTLASATLANSLLQPGAPPYGLQAGGGVGLGAGESTGGSSVSAWSAPSLSSGMGVGTEWGPAGIAEVPAAMTTGTATAAALAAATAVAAAAARQSVIKDTKVKVLLYSGGAFSRCPSGVWEYSGGETRLVAVPRMETYRELTSAIAKAVPMDFNEEALILKYELPGLPDQLVDLLTDDDVTNMWEALEEYCVADQKPTFKLKILVQQAGQLSSAAGSRSSRSDSGATGADAGSAAGDAAGGDGGGDGKASSGSSSGRGQQRSLGPPPHTTVDGSAAGSDGGGSGAVSAAAVVGLQPPQRKSGGGAPYMPPIPEFDSMVPGRMAGAPTAPPDLALAEPGTLQAAATLAAAAAVVAPTPGGGGEGGATVPYDAVAASEREAEQALLRSEIGSLVTTDPRVSLSDLESKLEIIRPEDLKIIKFLGSGGYGEVYLCHWQSCDVAVKCLNPSLMMPDTASGGSSMSSDVVTELLKEAAMLGGLRHPNIVWVYGIVLPSGVREVKAKRERLDAAGDIDVVRMTAALAAGIPVMPGVIRPPALVTEYLGAGSLRAALTRGSDFLRSDMVRVKLALDAARGMEYLHLKRIVHFDLKTANLLVGFREKTPTCKVADFGLSKQRQQTYVTGVSSLRGTLPWTAPEIIRTPKAVKDKADVYSFGVVMWELWTFREPFEGINYHALLHQISVSKDPVRPAMPGGADWEGPDPEEPAPGWVVLMCRCWDEDPDTRPPFTRVVSELESMLAALKAKRRATSA